MKPVGIIEHNKMEEKIKELKEQLTGDMVNDMEIRNEIHNLEMKLNNVKPTNSHIECVGCGS